MTAKQQRQEEIYDRWYEDFKIVKLEHGSNEHKLAREILEFALSNPTKSLPQAVLLYMGKNNER